MKATNKQRWGSRLQRLFLLCCFVVPVCSLFCHGHERTMIRNGEYSLNDTKKKQEGLPRKWIPHLRILAGSPETVLDLNGILEQLVQEGYLGDDSTLDRKKLKVSLATTSDAQTVIPEIKGTDLFLHWGKEGTSKTDVVLRVETPEQRHAYVSFQAGIWEPNYLWISSVVLGGLGLFLLGMKHLSDGLQTVAGSSLRRMIALFTDNRFLAVGIGLFATAVIQSSSVTTVMVVGFINSGLMTLQQGIGVIMGANIGTTATGWILALKIGDFGLPILGLAALFYLFSQNERIRYTALAFLGLGFVFFGLKTMENGLSDLCDIPAFSLWMKSFTAETFPGVLKCVFTGCVLTLIVQSSSATVGITLSLASLGIIQFDSAVALVLGENIGTTITALLASIGTTTNARRAACFHSIFNVLGVTWVLILFFPFFLPLVTHLAHVENGKNITAGIALAHTLFNLTNTIVFLPFVPFFAAFLTRFVKERKTKEASSSSLVLENRATEPPLIAVERSRIEILRMFAHCRQLFAYLEDLKNNNYSEQEKIEQCFQLEAQLDDLQHGILRFIGNLIPKNLSVELSLVVQEQVHVSEELERISDYLVDILKSNLKLRDLEQSLPDLEKKRLSDLQHAAHDLLSAFSEFYTDRQTPNKYQAYLGSRHRAIIFQIKNYRYEFQITMFDRMIDPAVVIAYQAQLNAWRRVCVHIQNLADAISSPSSSR